MSNTIMKRVMFFLLMVTIGGWTFAQESVPHTTIAEQVRGTDSTSSGFVADVLTWYDAHMNYTTVGLLMALESSFVPFPSEVVIPPAVYVACNPDSRSGMTLWLIVLIGTLGALIGAYINYFLSRWLGRPIIYAFAESKVGHLLSLSKEKVQRAEVYFNDHGSISTLVGRLIPAAYLHSCGSFQDESRSLLALHLPRCGSVELRACLAGMAGLSGCRPLGD